MMTRRHAVHLLCIALIACGNGKKTEEDADDEQDTSGDNGPDLPLDGPCTSDEECSNGLFCDGEETCGSDGTCEPGTAAA